MTTRRIVLIALGLLLLFGVANFIINSIRTRAELAKIGAKNSAQQEEGVRNLMARSALFDALQGGAPKETRLNAVAALQRIAAPGNDPKAFDQLLQMLKDPDTESAEAKTHPVRDAAMNAVANVGLKYVPRLIDAAKDQDGAIKDQSRTAIRQKGPELKTAMAEKLGDGDLRAPFGDILAGIGPETVPLITPYLKPPLLKPDDAGAKVQLIEIMGKYKAPEPPKPGVPPAKDAPTPQQIAAQRALVEQAARAVIPFKNDPDPNVRRTVVTSLANIALPVAAPTLIEALNDPSTDSDARAAAAGALGAIATPEANAAMMKALADYDLRVATAAAAGLKRAGDRARTSIAAALANPDPAVRARAAEATGGMTTPDLAARALKDPDPDVREAAVRSLGDLRSPAAIAPLLSVLADTGGAVAESASASLGRMGASAIGPLVARLSTGDDTVAYRAALALQAIGKPAVDPLIALARSGKPAARWAAITLGQIGDPRAAPALKTLSDSAKATNPDAAYAADTALAKIGQG